MEQLLREGARNLLQAAIENEVLEYIQFHKDRLDENGQRLVVRNGHRARAGSDQWSGTNPGSSATGPAPGPGALYQCDSAQVYAPGSQRRCFDSSPLPQGISSGDFSEALTAILGEGASGLSAANILRLKSGWETEYKAWNQRDLSTKRYVYWWADGIYFNVRLDEERTCVLVLIGATKDGRKELLAVVDGYRESTQSWRELLRQLKPRSIGGAQASHR